MTALNWDGDRAKRKAKELSFDDLPPVGSYRDQRRCGYHVTRGGVRAGSHHEPLPVHQRNRVNDFDQLDHYLSHARHPDASRWRVCQKTELAQIIKKLIIRCEAWGAVVTTREAALMIAAHEAVIAMSH